MNKSLYDRALKQKETFISWANNIKFTEPFDFYAEDFIKSFSFITEHLEDGVSEKMVEEFLDSADGLIEYFKETCTEEIVSTITYDGPNVVKPSPKVSCNARELCRWLYKNTFPTFQARLESKFLLEFLKTRLNNGKEMFTIKDYEKYLKKLDNDPRIFDSDAFNKFSYMVENEILNLAQ
jgi:hypothetical protein